MSPRTSKFIKIFLVAFPITFVVGLAVSWSINRGESGMQMWERALLTFFTVLFIAYFQTRKVE